MSAVTRPPLLELGGEEAFREYEKEFGRLYQHQRVYDILGKAVEFPGSSCWHVCFKRDESDRSARRNRDIWSQERANRIPWILAALNDPKTEVRPNDKDPINRLNYLFVVDAEPLNNLPTEYFIVVTERISRTTVRFTTAYPITLQEWRGYKKSGAALYPLKVGHKKKKGGA